MLQMCWIEIRLKSLLLKVFLWIQPAVSANTILSWFCSAVVNLCTTNANVHLMLNWISELEQVMSANSESSGFLFEHLMDKNMLIFEIWNVWQVQCAGSFQLLLYCLIKVFDFFIVSFLFLAKEQEFLQKQQQELDGALKKIIQQHKCEVATVERGCLNHKQQLLRGEA